MEREETERINMATGSGPDETRVSRVKVVFLHGIGSATSPEEWLPALNRELASAGFEDLTPDDLIDFDYGRILAKAYASNAPEPLEAPTGSPGPEVLNEHLQRKSRLRERLAEFRRESGGFASWVPPVVGDIGASLKREVDNYRSDASVRHLIWSQVLGRIPRSGEVVLVGHSLGSVIAADLVSRLPAGIRVRSLITIASPLGGVKELRRHSMELASEATFPFDRVGLWVNIYDPADIVTIGRGISRQFPVALDVPVGVARLRPGAPLAHHAIGNYATHPTVALAIAEAVWGLSLPAPADGTPARGISPMWYPQLAKFAYSKCLYDVIPSDQTDRRLALGRAREELARRADSAARAAAGEISRAAGAGADDDDAAGAVSAARNHPDYQDFVDHPIRLLQGRFAPEDLVPLAMVLLQEPPTAPFTAEVQPRAERLAALRVFLTAVGTQADSGSGAADASKDFAVRCTAACRSGRRTGRRAMKLERLTAVSPWVRGTVLGVLGVGLVTGTVLSFGALAPTGVAGAAAVSASLAAFGPGGMASGVVLIGVLTGVGTGSVAQGTSELVRGTKEQRRRWEAEARADLHSALAEQVLSADPHHLRFSLATLIGVVVAQEELGQVSSRQSVMAAVSVALAAVRAEADTARLIEPRSGYAKQLAVKEKWLVVARRWLDGDPDPEAEMQRALERAEGILIDPPPHG